MTKSNRPLGRRLRINLTLRKCQRDGATFKCAFVIAPTIHAENCVFATDPELAIRLCGESSRTTHGARTCIDACRYFGGLIVGALRGAPKDELLSERYCPVPGLWERAPLCVEIDEIAAGSFKRLEPPEIVGSGYVVKSLEAALWAFNRSETFADGCLMAVNLGRRRRNHCRHIWSDRGTLGRRWIPPPVSSHGLSPHVRGGPLGLEVLGVTVYELCVAGHSFWAVFEWLVLKKLRNSGCPYARS